MHAAGDDIQVNGHPHRVHPITVLIDPIIRDIIRPREALGILIITVLPPHRLRVLAVPIDIPQVITVAVLVNTIIGNLWRCWRDVGVAVIAVLLRSEPVTVRIHRHRCVPGIIS